MKLCCCIAVILLFLLGCTKKDVAQLPPITHFGANTFGCKINGEIFSVSRKSYQTHSDGVTLYASSTTAWLVEGTLQNKSIALQFDYMSNPSVPETFTMGLYEPYRGHYFYYPDGTVPTGSTEWITDELHDGTVTLTDYTSTYASGTFAFDAMNGDGDIVHVTEGRFDISF